MYTIGHLAEKCCVPAANTNIDATCNGNGNGLLGVGKGLIKFHQSITFGLLININRVDGRPTYTIH
jgi:hypothetical protein